MKYGELIGKIRRKKGFRQEELAEGLFSVRTLSRVEHGEIELKAEAFVELLNRLGMSVSEFLMIYHKENGEAPYEGSFRQLSKELSKEYEATGKVDEKKKDELLRRFDLIQKWGYHEIYDYSTVLFLFPTDSILAQHRRILKFLDKYSFNIEMKYITEVYFLSCLKLFALRKEIEHLKSFLSQYSERIGQDYFKGKNWEKYYEFLLASIETKNQTLLLQFISNVNELGGESLSVEMKKISQKVISR